MPRGGYFFNSLASSFRTGVEDNAMPKHYYKNMRPYDAQMIREEYFGLPPCNRPTHADLARRNGCTDQTIGRILRGETFKAILPPPNPDEPDIDVTDLYDPDPDDCDDFLNPELETNVNPETEAYTAPAPKAGGYSLNATKTECTLPDGRTVPCRTTPGAPPMLVDPSGKINHGKPTSVYDLQYELAHGKKLKGKHAVPTKNAEGTRDYTTFNPYDCDVLTVTALYKEEMARPGRGRRTSITPSIAASIKSAYYRGDEKIAEIAGSKEFGNLSTPTVRKVIYGEASWYS